MSVTQLKPNKAHVMDQVEELFLNQNLPFQRVSKTELVAELDGQSCDYKLFFIWREDLNAIHFYCQYDLYIPQENMHLAGKTLMGLNEALWLGHFELSTETHIPVFRHSCLMQFIPEDRIADAIEEIVDVAIAACDYYFPSFFVMSGSEPLKQGDDLLNLAMMDTVGES